MSLSIMRPQTADRQQRETTAATVPPTIAIYTCQRSQEPFQAITSEHCRNTDPTYYQTHARPRTKGGGNQFGGAFIY